MQAERWQQIERLFHLALDKKRDERQLFLAEVCAGDEVLRNEIEELISSHEQAEEFIESPASDLAAELLGHGQSELKLGEKIGPYEIQSVLGIGGMGEVYVATDARLSRRVALKLLPPKFTFDPERIRRFEQEARAASALNHPNIVTIHEIGHFNGARFIVTEFVEGQTLRQLMNEKPFTLNEALNVAIQVAGALVGAHSAGIVHRDIKPENIMLRVDGYVKILDFGLAKLIETQTSDSETDTLLQSNPGLVMGTVQYMSPEQARGKNVDLRADLWSLGVVLYELLARRVPFSGETPSHVMVSLMEDELPALTSFTSVPAELDRIVTRALRKNKRERYQTARELVHDLKELKRDLQLEGRLNQFLGTDEQPRARATKSSGQALAGKATPAEDTARVGTAHLTSGFEYVVARIKRHRLSAAVAVATVIVTAVIIAFSVHRGRVTNVARRDDIIDSIAVLPFENAGRDPNNDHLADGISDSLIGSLSHVPTLQVTPFNSVLRYKGKQTDLQSIGRELNVRAVLKGTMRLEGDRIFIDTQIVDVRDNQRFWDVHYNGDLANIVSLQNIIGRQMSEKLRLRLSVDDKKRLISGSSQHEANQLYALGLQSLGESTKEGMEKSIEYFETAIKMDPNFARPYDGLYRAYYGLGQRAYWLPNESRQKMEWAAFKAVELDETSIQAHIALATVRKVNWDWAGAEKEYKRALELGPDSFGPNFSPNLSYAIFLMDVGRLDEAMVYAKRAEELDPHSTAVVAHVYLYQSDYDKALEELSRKGNRASSDTLMLAYIGKGRFEEAIAEVQKDLARNESPESWGGYPMLAYTYGKAGRREEALKILRAQQRLAKRRYISPFNFAIIYTGLGDKDRAFEYLNKACEDHALQLSHYARGALFESLYSDQRYNELLRCMKFGS